MAFTQKLLQATITLASPNTFVESGTNTVTLSNLRMSARVVKAGGVSLGQLSLDIWGMTLSVMNQLSTLGMLIQLIPRNTITLLAGDASGLSIVFTGSIMNAYTNFQASPEVAFHIDAHTLMAESVISATPTSVNGTASAATLLSGLAAQMGLTFQNNGVTALLSNPYYSGSARAQALAIVKDVNIYWNGGDNGVLAIWPKNSACDGEIPMIAPPPDGEMIGYPAYTQQGIMVKTLFNKAISFGAKVQVQSSLTPACGTWVVLRLDHDLDSMLPNGKWESSLGCYSVNFPEPVLQ